LVHLINKTDEEGYEKTRKTRNSLEILQRRQRTEKGEYMKKRQNMKDKKIKTKIEK